MSNEKSKKGPVKFKSREAVKEFIDGICEKNALDDRDHLARVLGISSSALYGYIFRSEIPEKMHRRMKSLHESGETGSAKTTAIKSAKEGATDLSPISLDDLVAEIERRGWKIDLSRAKKEQS